MKSEVHVFLLITFFICNYSKPFAASKRLRIIIEFSNCLYSNLLFFFSFLFTVFYVYTLVLLACHLFTFSQSRTTSSGGYFTHPILPPLQAVHLDPWS